MTHLAIIAPPALLSGAPRRDLSAFHAEPTNTDGWNKFNAVYWRHAYHDFVDFFCRQIVNQPHSTKHIEDLVNWGLATTPQVLTATIDESATPNAAEFAAAIRCPVLIVHGSDDAVMALSSSEALHAAIPHSVLKRLDGAGHGVVGRAPVRINLLLHEFLGAARIGDGNKRRISTRGPKRALFVSSSIGLGHVYRDLAIASALRQAVGGLQIDWLTQDPVTRVLRARGERIHPLSAELANESQHVESESGEHDLHAFQAWRRMDEILVANFLVFYDAVKDAKYDLWLADEGWDIDYFLHENPRLKSAPYVWLTDFVGWLPVAPDEELLTTDYNAEMLGHIERHPRVRDLALFVGNPADIVPDRFGRDLPYIRQWVESHFQLPGYIQYLNTRQYEDRRAVRARLGYDPDERIIVAAVGGTAVGQSLLRRIIESFDQLRHQCADVRLVAVAGPRIDPASLPAPKNVDVRGHVPDLFEHLAVCDLAVVQGGLTTTMELVSTGRPFLYFPLRHHFEQAFHVPYRLQNYGVQPEAQVDYATASADSIAERMLGGLSQTNRYRSVETGAAAVAARMIAELL